MAKSKKPSDGKISETQAHAVAEDLAEEFAQKTTGMEKEEIWEAAGHLVVHFASVENMIDQGETEEEENLLVSPAYGEPAWSEDHPDEEEKEDLTEGSGEPASK